MPLRQTPTGTSRHRWLVPDPVSPDAVVDLASKLEIPPLIAELALTRGIDPADTGGARRFLFPRLSDLYDPSLLQGMEQAVERIATAVKRGERILVYGDYDVDGVTGVALLASAIGSLGGVVATYLPHRLQEGYGVSEAGVRHASQMGVGLIVTVDCGITASREVSLASSMGMDCIVTDHHEPKQELPDAVAILDPKCEDSGYPYPELAGVGVAFKLAHALAGRENGPGLRFSSFLDLVALGSLADMVPVDGENRVLAKFGLEALQKTERIGLQTLLDTSGLAGVEKLSTAHVGFTLAPRLNAAGRLGDARWALRLLQTEDREEAIRIAGHLEDANRERRELEDRIVEEAMALVREHVDLGQDRVIVLASPAWHQGVIGIVASRLAERFYRPTIIIAVRDGKGKGSARSIPAFHLYDALRKASRHLISFGGHRHAAGINVNEESIVPLRAELNRIAGEILKPDELIPSLRVDIQTTLDLLEDDLPRWLDMLSPFGYGNPQPVFLARDLKIVGYPSVVGGNHLRFKVRQGGKTMAAIGFGLGHLARELSTGTQGVRLVFTVEENEWQGKRQLQLRVRDLDC
jgi:single-stranded-DNA-specific exonuclease